MRQLLYRLRALGSPHHNSRNRGAHSRHYIDKTLHAALPFRPDFDPALCTAAHDPCGLDAGMLPDVDKLSEARGIRSRLRVSAAVPHRMDAMDRVGLGRALGYGARHAAKSLLAAADAAAAPDPNAVARTRSQASAETPAEPTARAGSNRSAASRTVREVIQTTTRAHAVSGKVARHAGRSFFSPLVRFSRVVTLQVTGTFFALIALVMGQAAWRSRAVAHLGPGAADARRFYVLAAVCLVFSYFALSSFLRARRRERR